MTRLISADHRPVAGLPVQPDFLPLVLHLGECSCFDPARQDVPCPLDGWEDRGPMKRARRAPDGVMRHDEGRVYLHAVTGDEMVVSECGERLR